MKLSERILTGNNLSNGPARSRLDRDRYYAFKSRVHFRLVKLLDLATVAELPKEELAATIRQTLQELTEKERLPLNRQERTTLVSDLMDEIMGLGPIEGLVADNSIQDILINGYRQIYIERNGILHRTPIQFRDNDHLMQIVDKIVSAVGRRVDESSPMVDARLPDGSRVNVILPPLALNGPVISIRKFGQNPIRHDDLIRNRSMTPEMLSFLDAAIQAKLNILVSGGTGAGKTTLLNVLSGCIPNSERIITIEDSAELRLHQPHVVSLESRPSNVEGRGQVTLTDLVKNCLRMRPDRIIVGEARGPEVMDMLQAMNTGHPGSMSTIHANSPQDALSRMEVMASMGANAFSEQALRRLIANAINIIVQLARLPDGRRRVISICEVTGLKLDRANLQDIFVFVQQGVSEEGQIFGEFRGCGTCPECMEHLRAHGQQLDEACFSIQSEVN